MTNEDKEKMHAIITQLSLDMQKQTIEAVTAALSLESVTNKEVFEYFFSVHLEGLIRLIIGGSPIFRKDVEQFLGMYNEVMPKEEKLRKIHAAFLVAMGEPTEHELKLAELMINKNREDNAKQGVH